LPLLIGRKPLVPLPGLKLNPLGPFEFVPLGYTPPLFMPLGFIPAGL
jgi:hypothetical protein